MQDIFWGAAIISIGLFMGGSVFFGDFSLLNIIFDGAGTFFIVKGLLGFTQKASTE
jgi:hypothetical protein